MARFRVPWSGIVLALLVCLSFTSAKEAGPQRDANLPPVDDLPPLEDEVMPEYELPIGALPVGEGRKPVVEEEEVTEKIPKKEHVTTQLTDETHDDWVESKFDDTFGLILYQERKVSAYTDKAWKSTLEELDKLGIHIEYAQAIIDDLTVVDSSKWDPVELFFVHNAAQIQLKEVSPQAVAWEIRHHLRPNYEIINNVAHFKRYVNTFARSGLPDEYPEPTVVGFFADMMDIDPERSSLIGDLFNSAVAHFGKRLRFVVSTSIEMIESYGWEDAIVVFMPQEYNSKHQIQQHKYKGNFTAVDLVQWLNLNSQPDVGHYNIHNMWKYMRPGNYLWLAQFDINYRNEDSRKAIRELAERMREIRQHQNSRALRFAYSYGTPDLYGNIPELGPGVMQHNIEGGHWKFFGDFWDNGELYPYLKRLMSHKMDPWVKSAPEPEGQETSGNYTEFKTVVGTTFKQMVIKRSSDEETYCVMVMHTTTAFENPKVLGVVEKTLERFTQMQDAGEESIVALGPVQFGHMDIEQNDGWQKTIPVDSVPSIWMTPVFGDTALKYTGELGVKELLQWITEMIHKDKEDQADREELARKTEKRKSVYKMSRGKTQNFEMLNALVDKYGDVSFTSYEENYRNLMKAEDVSDNVIDLLRKKDQRLSLLHAQSEERHKSFLLEQYREQEAAKLALANAEIIEETKKKYSAKDDSQLERDRQAAPDFGDLDGEDAVDEAVEATLQEDEAEDHDEL